MSKLRLLVTERCNRSCPGCCNKDWDLPNLPICSDFSPYKLIMLTGGEIMTMPVKKLQGIIRKIRCLNPDATLIAYTAASSSRKLWDSIIPMLDGVTITFHDQQDTVDFKNYYKGLTGKSVRINIFKDIWISPSLRLTFEENKWDIKEGIEWIENCPLPSDEDFLRYGKAGV